MKPRILPLVTMIIISCVILSLLYTSASISKQQWSALRLMDSGLPQLHAIVTNSSQPQTSDAHVDRILVVYSGPTDLMDQNIKKQKISSAHKKMELYRLNFEFFLRHGIHCQTQDTLIVVTGVVAAKYQAQIDELHNRCHHDYGNFVRIITRNNTCYDLESVRVALEFAENSDRPAVETNRRTKNDPNFTAFYDFFVYVNCGVTGPSLQWTNRPWTSIFLEKLRDGVKMTGLSINCEMAGHPHVQSMMYAMDREGLQFVVDGGAIYDCKTRPDHAGLTGVPFQGMIIWEYEIKMSDLLLHAGYGISSVVMPTALLGHNSSQCLNKHGNETVKDIWITNHMNEYLGKVPSLDDVVFFKTSRILTPETANLINFTLDVDWNW